MGPMISDDVINIWEAEVESAFTVKTGTEKTHVASCPHPTLLNTWFSSVGLQTKSSELGGWLAGECVWKAAGRVRE